MAACANERTSKLNKDKKEGEREKIPNIQKGKETEELSRPTLAARSFLSTLTAGPFLLFNTPVGMQETILV